MEQELSSMMMPSCHHILMTFCRTKTTSHPSTFFIATRAEAIDLGSEVGCVVYIIKANTVIDCQDGEASHMYTDDNLT